MAIYYHSGTYPLGQISFSISSCFIFFLSSINSFSSLVLLSSTLKEVDLLYLITHVLMVGAATPITIFFLFQFLFLKKYLTKLRFFEV
jgi:hypothetical protein